MFEARRTVRMYVVFQGSYLRSLWSVFTRRGFRHCWVFYPVYFPKPGLMAVQWIVKIEAAHWGIHSDLVYISAADAVQELCERGCRVLSLPVDLPPKRNYVLRGPVSCVVIAKAVMGIAPWWIISPHGLYRHLLRIGAKREGMQGNGGAG